MLCFAGNAPVAGVRSFACGEVDGADGAGVYAVDVVGDAEHRVVVHGVLRLRGSVGFVVWTGNS